MADPIRSSDTMPPQRTTPGGPERPYGWRDLLADLGKSFGQVPQATLETVQNAPQFGMDTLRGILQSLQTPGVMMGTSPTEIGRADITPQLDRETMMGFLNALMQVVQTPSMRAGKGLAAYSKLVGPKGPIPEAMNIPAPSNIPGTAPPPGQGMQRLWRGEHPSTGMGPETSRLQRSAETLGGILGDKPSLPTAGQVEISPLGRPQGRFYTDQPGTAGFYAHQVPGESRVSYVDVPRAEAAKMRLGMTVGDPYHDPGEFLVPESYHQRRIAEPTLPAFEQGTLQPAKPIVPAPWEIGGAP